MAIHLDSIGIIVFLDGRLSPYLTLNAIETHQHCGEGAGDPIRYDTIDDTSKMYTISCTQSAE